MHAPTGHITLLFSEIDGMAALWREAPDLAEVVTARHDPMMRRLLEAHQGYEVKIEDDLLMSAFAEAEQALAFAAEAQRAILREPWPQQLLDIDGFGLVEGEGAEPLFAGPRLRMGLHAGEANARVVPSTQRTDYFGPIPNRAARIMSAAHPGQVLLSDAVGRAAPDGTLLCDLGVHRLSGVASGVQLFSFPVEGLLERRFPPPETLDAKRTNLNARANRFVGREAVIASLWNAFEQGYRLVTLMGPSGVGKTRLAQHFGSLELDHFPGGVWFCDLVTCRDRHALLAQLAEALSLPLSAGHDPATAISSALTEQGEMLLILDNLEQVIEPASALVGDWLARCPELRVLCTSQERLRLVDEQVVEMAGLSEAEAMALFRARLGEANRAALSPHELAQLADLVRILDRVPLAIELAAAQLANRSLSALRDSLAGGLGQLRASAMDLPARHRSLRAAFEWSWSLLNETERLALCQISVFRGGFTLDAAEAILQFGPDAPWVLDLLETLNDKSLLRTIERGHELRFELFESVRQLAYERLSQNDELRALLEERHARYYCQLGLDAVAGLFGRDSAQHLERIKHNQHNLMAVCDGDDIERRGQATLALSGMLKIQGPNRARLELLQSIEGQWDEMPANLRCQLQRAQAEALKEDGDLQGALAVLEAARASADKADNPRLLGRVMGTMGLIRRALGQLDEAKRAMELALRIARNCDDDPTRGSMLNNLASIAHDQGQLDACHRLMLEALELAQARGRALGTATAQVNLGTLAAERGQHEDALIAYTRAAATFDSLGRIGYAVTARAMIGLTELDRGSLDEAERILASARKEAQDQQDPTVELMASCWLGLTFWLRGDDKAAAPLLRAAVRLIPHSNAPNSYGFAAAYHGAMMARQGRPRAARKALEEARQMAINSGSRATKDTITIIAGLASAYLLDHDDYAADEASTETLLAMAEKRLAFCDRASGPSAHYPDGLVAPTRRSIDARIAKTLLTRQLRQHSRAR